MSILSVYHYLTKNVMYKDKVRQTILRVQRHFIALSEIINIAAYLHEVDEELRLLGESFLERFRFTHWRKPHVFEQRITGEDLQMTCTQISCRNKNGICSGLH